MFYWTVCNARCMMIHRIPEEEFTMLIYLQMIETPEDQSKFEQIYEKYLGLMYHVALKILENHEDAEDAVHQAFVSIAENIKTIHPADCPETKSVTISFVRKVEKLLSGETICAHQINCRTAHEPCPVIDTTAGKHL